MADDPRASFWTTMPGILTGLAAVLTAIGGLALALNQAGVFTHSATVPAAASTPVAAQAATPSASRTVTATLKTEQGAQPQVPMPPPVLAPVIPEANLISPDNGGHLVAASSDDWQMTIDGDETNYKYLTGEGVYAFKGDAPVTFDTFGVLIPNSAGLNLAEYELSAGDTSPTGPFRVIGKFKTQNIKLFGSPYQEVRFTPVTARYFRVRIIGSFDGGNTIYGYEFRLRRS